LINQNPTQRPTAEQVVKSLDNMIRQTVLTVYRTALPVSESENIIEAELDTNLLHLYHSLLLKPPTEVDEIIEPFICPGCNELIFQYPSFEVPAVDTYYACAGFSFSNLTTEHIVRFEAIVDQQAVLHHMVLYTLNEGYAPYSSTPIGCNMPSNAIPIFAWGPGSDPVTLPPQAGFRVGGNSGVINAVLNFHYNNPGLLSGLVDSSAIKMYLTPTLREFDAGMWFLGVDPSDIAIPPYQKNWHISGGCPGVVTKSLPNSVQIFDQFTHMHYVGIRLWTEQYRNGILINNLANTTNYDFNAQHFSPINITVEPGDELITHCVYDSTDRNYTVVGGEDSSNEMCYNIVMYFPVVPDATGCIAWPTPGCDCDQGQPCLESLECTNVGTSCSRYTNCSSCSADSNCGWCDSSSLVQCLATDLESACSSGLKGNWNVCNESIGTPCADHSSCDVCNSDHTNGCSWCSFTTISSFPSMCLAGADASLICSQLDGNTLGDQC